MATVQQIIDVGDKLIAKSQRNLINKTKGIELAVYAALMQIFDNVEINNGVLASTPKAEEFLAALDYQVYQALKKSGYNDNVKEFTNSFNGVQDNIIDVHSKLGNGLIQAKDIAEIKRIEVSKTISNLTTQGMYANFVSPVTQGLYRNIMFGATVADTKAFIKSQIISTEGTDSKLLRYVGQVATDSIHQFDGAANQAIKTKFKLNAIQYTGSLIQDSRAQCMKWISMAIIKDDELQSEIDFALEKSYYSNKRCSGMIAETNPDTFCVCRGGYRCRHRAFGIRLVKK